LGGEPAVIIETKNEAGKSRDALVEACAYAETINATGRFSIRIVAGVSGNDETGYIIEAAFLVGSEWLPLRSRGQELTNVPSVSEAELALAASDGTTSVSIPSTAEFIEAAIELSNVMRRAKVEATLRPKVIGAITLAMYQGELDLIDNPLEMVNDLVEVAIGDAVDLPGDSAEQLIDALHLTRADFDRLTPYLGRVIAILRRLNIRSVLQSDMDALGTFYEAFLRYGYDNNALGIVFTPRHITRYCIELVGCGPRERVIDIACGTGGFLVAAFDEMMRSAESEEARDQVKRALAGSDTNPTVWALAMLNLFFPTAAPTTILIAKAHIPQDDAASVFMSRVSNDGFVKSKVQCAC